MYCHLSPMDLLNRYVSCPAEMRDIIGFFLHSWGGSTSDQLKAALHRFAKTNLRKGVPSFIILHLTQTYMQALSMTKEL